MVPLSSSFCITDINELAEVNAIKVFPNPAVDLFFIEYDLLKVNDLKLSVFNTLGELIYEEESKNQQRGKHKKQIDFNFPKGVYMLQVQIGTDRLSYKLIKEN